MGREVGSTVVGDTEGPNVGDPVGRVVGSRVVSMGNVVGFKVVPVGETVGSKVVGDTEGA